MKTGLRLLAVLLLLAASFCFYRASTTIRAQEPAPTPKTIDQHWEIIHGEHIDGNLQDSLRALNARGIRVLQDQVELSADQKHYTIYINSDNEDCEDCGR